MIETNIKPKDGHIFKVCIGEDIYSYGQIIDIKYNLYTIYANLSDIDEDLSSLGKNPIMFFTRLNDNPFKYSNWSIIGESDIPRELEFNKSKVILEKHTSVKEIIESSTREGIDLLDKIGNISSQELENAIRFEYGIESLCDNYKNIIYPAYKRNKEINEIIKKSNKERYEYFIKNIVYYGEVWALYNEGLAITEDYNGEDILPLWPKREYAENYTKNIWIDYTPIVINLNEFIDEWIDDMKNDNLKPSIFWVNGESLIPELDKLKYDIQCEVEKFSIGDLDELSNVALSDRYTYFIDKTLESEEVWFLYNDGFAMIDYEDESSIPVWSKREYAQKLINDEFEGYIIKRMDLDEFMNYLLPDLDKNDIYLAVNYDGEGSVLASATDILYSLKR